MDLTTIRPTEGYQLGHMQRLKILRRVSIGAYLDGGGTDILLPLRYLPETAEVGDEVSVFVYHDNEGRLIATTLKPLAEVGQVAYLRCRSVTEQGAFLEWGIHKDLFVPFREQKVKMQEGYNYVVYLYIDQLTGRILASARLAKHLDNTPATYEPGQIVHALVVEANDRGYRCIVENHHWGMIYIDEVDQMLKRGDLLEVWVVRVRDDNRIDLSLRPVGYQKTSGESERLLRLLDSHGGTLPIGDKSPASEILRLTGLSKKTFKMVLGVLYRERKVRLEPTAVHRI